MGTLYRRTDLDYLQLSIESILNQTYGNFEFLICDDGSTPEAKQMLEAFREKDSRIKLIRPGNKIDLASKLNACIQEAAGGFIARMDDDDYAAPERFEKQLAFLEAHADVAFVGCSVTLLRDGVRTGARIFPEYPMVKDFFITQPYIHPTLMFRRQVLDKAGGYSEERRQFLCEDYDLLLRLYSMGYRGANLQEQLLVYRVSTEKAHRKMIHRWNESVTRWERFRELRLLPYTFPFVLKPLAAGLVRRHILERHNLVKNNLYRNKRPYRYYSTTNSFFLSLMEKRFEHPFSDAWEQFGYEIGGPVCYSFVRWLSSVLDQDTEVTGLVFVARDGYLLKKCFGMLPRDREMKSAYIYATRAVAKSCTTPDGVKAFLKHIESFDFGDGIVGVVDTVTMKFTSQKLVETQLGRRTRGYFWTTLRSSHNYGEGLDYRSFQSEHYHLIRCWNLIEFIISSPEPPISGMKDGLPAYDRTSGWEAERSVVFKRIESGVLSFMTDLCAEESFPSVGSEDINEWVNTYLKNPSPEDVEIFEGVKVSEDTEHSTYIPLDPFRKKGLWKTAKDSLWFYSQRHPVIYRFFHALNLKRMKKELNKK